MAYTLSDLTRDERDALELRFDGPIPSSVVADTIANRRPKTAAEQISILRSRARVAAALAEDATQALAALIERRDAATPPFVIDNLNQAIARRTREQENWTARAADLTAQADALESPHVAQAAE